MSKIIALRLLEIADHLGADRRRSPFRSADVRIDGGTGLLARRPAAGAGPLRGGARGRAARRRATSRRRRSTRARGCTNMAAAPGRWMTARSISRSSPTGGSIARPTAARRSRSRPAPPRAERLALCRRRDRSQPRSAGSACASTTPAPARPVNTIVAVDLAGAARSPAACSRGGHDFFSSPRLSPDGSKLAVARLGPSQHAVERHDALSRDARRRRHAAGEPRGDRRRRRGVRSSSRNGRPTAARSSSCPTAPAGGISIAMISRGATRARLPRARPNSASRNGCSACRPTRSPGRTASCAPIRRPASAASRCSTSRPEALRPLDTPFTEFGVGARRRRPRGVPRRRPDLAGLRRRARSAHRHAPVAEEVDRHPRPRRPAHRRLPDDGPARSSFRPPAARPHSACSIRRSIPITPAPAGEKPPLVVEGARRPDRGGVEHALAAQPVLDQPRHRGARRELRRQHRLRARISRAAVRQLGRGRRRGLHQRREVPGAAGAGRREARGHHRRQRRRLHRAGGARVPRLLPGRREPLWRQRHRGAGARHAQVRVALSRLADRTVSAGGGALSRALAAVPRRARVEAGDLLPGRRGRRGAAEPDRDDGRGAAPQRQSRSAISCSPASSTASARPATSSAASMPSCISMRSRCSGPG